MKNKHVVIIALLMAIGAEGGAFAQSNTRTSRRTSSNRSIRRESPTTKPNKSLPDRQALTRETASVILAELVSTREETWQEGFDLFPGSATPAQMRKMFPAFRLAEECGWLTMHVENGQTIFALTESGKRLFEEKRPFGVRKSGDREYDFVVGTRPVFGRITGIVTLSPIEKVVEYTWVWKLADYMPADFETREYSATAVFIKYDDGWRLQPPSKPR